MRHKNKNPHYKSALSIFSGADQTLTATAAPLNFGVSVTTNTGIALEPHANYVDVNYTGLYEFDFSVIVNATTAGDITIQLRENGSAMAETARTITVPVGYSEIDVKTIRYVKGSFEDPSQIMLYANTDGTAAAVVDIAAATAVKLA